MSVDRPVEIELKYRLADRSIGEAILAGERLGSLAASGSSDETHHDDRYFDTNDGAIAAAGYAARVRETPEGSVVALKSLAGSDDAMHRRAEIEGPALTELAPVLWPASNARALLLELAGDALLTETARIRQTRRRRRFAADSTVVEVSLDDVEVVRAGDVMGRFTELEIELLSGPESAIEDLAGIVGGEGVTSSRESKLQAALALLANAESAASPPPPVESKPARPHRRPKLQRAAGVGADDSLAEAGRKVLRFHLARMIAREPGTRSGKDPEDLHAMRVATRRMRAAWRVFGDAFRRGHSRRLQRPLRDIARALGAVRDLDVLIEAGERHRAEVGEADQAGLGRLFDAWRADRERARVALLKELDSEGYQRFVDDFSGFTMDDETGAAKIAAGQPHLVRDVAPARIWSAYHTVRAYDPVLRWADTQTLHALRIDAKRLRYSIEFFRDPLGPEAEDLVARVVALQDHLGELNDADVAAGLARQFLLATSDEIDAHEREAVGRYLVHLEREVARLRRTVGRPWRRVEGVTFRRALGRALAQL